MQRQFVERAQTGDHEAFSALVTASFPRAYRVAKLILVFDAGGRRQPA